MRKSENIKNDVIKVLADSNRWMTANEIVESAKDTCLNTWVSNGGHSHPVFRILSGMMKRDSHNVYTTDVKRRVRVTGPESGCFEYALTGLQAAIRRCSSAL